MAETTYQIHLALKDTEPKIWRRLLVAPDVFMSDLHKIIQTAMGWESAHLHQFISDGNFYEPTSSDNPLFSSGIDYTGMTLDKFLKRKNDTIEYEYDFGDGWTHRIKLEKRIEENETDTPHCIDGAMACPPEDVGGIWGFQRFKDALKEPEDPENKELIEWYGPKYDPEYFNKDSINKMLKTENYGVIEIY